MNAFVVFPKHLHWNAQQLAEAVPQRLHEMIAYEAGAPATAAGAVARAQVPPRREYLPASQWPLRFRVR